MLWRMFLAGKVCHKHRREKQRKQKDPWHPLLPESKGSQQYWPFQNLKLAVLEVLRFVRDRYSTGLATCQLLCFVLA